MARKSNKTAHVLNLLSGHDTKKEPEKELETDVKKDADPISEQDSQPKDAQQPHPDPEPTEKIPQGKISVLDSPSVSIIDQTEKDPVAEQIQANLFQEFQKEHDMNPEESQKESREKEPEAELPTQESEPSAEPEATAEAETNAAAEPERTTEAEPVAEPESTIVSEPEPEPEFVRINVMERIVSDKIIYFMRQFECCTCENQCTDKIAKVRFIRKSLLNATFIPIFGTTVGSHDLVRIHRIFDPDIIFHLRILFAHIVLIP